MGIYSLENPATTIINSKNGHVSYKDVYFVKPNGDLKKKSIQTMFNPSWSDLRIKGEMAFAFKNKKLIRQPVSTGKNIPGFSPPPQHYSIYQSFLTDGTKVEIKMYNFSQDPVTNTIKRDHLGFFQLVLK